jgi:hypothetical protein
MVWLKGSGDVKLGWRLQDRAIGRPRQRTVVIEYRILREMMLSGNPEVIVVIVCSEN